MNAIDPLGTTLVVSDHPFRGQNWIHFSHGQTMMLYGPYTKNFNDGSDKIKFLNKLTPERVADLKKKARDRLKCKKHSKNDRLMSMYLTPQFGKGLMIRTKDNIMKMKMATFTLITR